MSLRGAVRAVRDDAMRAYYLAVAAGLALTVSAFMPWVLVGERTLGGVPDLPGVWIFGLGLLATVLASLSLVTRKNSRHPLLLVGLVSFGVLAVAERLMEGAAIEQAWAVAQAVAIVDGVAAQPPMDTSLGTGIYLGLTASVVLVLFGLTIVVRRVANPYPEPENDDV